MANEIATTNSNKPSVMGALVSSRAAQEVQAQVMVARACPRDETRSLESMLAACKRKGMAENAMYAYPKGDQTVTGPSIRLAEVMARAWGNVEFGIREIEVDADGSLVEAFCWDMESNTRRTITFRVKHARYSKSRGLQKVSDPRDIYEIMANFAARRLRACILAVIPDDVQEACVAQVVKTLEGDSSGGGLAERVAKMAAAFDGLGVSLDDLESFMRHGIDATTEVELVRLRGVFTAIKDGAATPDRYFPRLAAKPTGSSSAAADILSDEDRFESEVGEQ